MVLYKILIHCEGRLYNILVLHGLRDELEVVANLCKKHDVIVIADEVYEWMIFKGHKHIKIGECRSCLPLIKLLNIFTRRMDCTVKTLISWTPSTTKARLYTKHGLKLSQFLLF